MSALAKPLDSVLPAPIVEPEMLQATVEASASPSGSE